METLLGLVLSRGGLALARKKGEGRD